MYKVKVAVLYMDGELDCRWNYGWIDWDGLDTEELDSILTEYGKSEEKMLKDNVDDSIKVVHALAMQTFDITDGKYQCCSCECFFDEPDDGYCPFCGSGNFVEGCIDEPEPDKVCFNHCPKCDASDDDIDWGEKDWGDESAWQNATCNKCGQEFSEVYVYSFTEKRHNR